MTDLYAIVRFHFKAENEVIAINASLEEAQEYCQRDDTHGDGWFDGYTEQTPYHTQEFLQTITLEDE